VSSIVRAVLIQAGIFALFAAILWLAADNWSDWCLLMAGLGGLANLAVAVPQRERQIKKHEEDE
jgi:hypothetical protein